LFSQQSKDSLYDFNPKKETFSNTKDIRIKYFATQAKKAAKGNQRAKTVRLTKITNPKIIINNLFTDLSNYKAIKKPKYILKTETETTTELRSVMGIKTPLNTISITLQDRRERNQESLSKQEASTTPLLVKGKKLWVQEFGNQMRMPKGTESIQSVSPKNNKSQQFLYLEEILTKSTGEKWEEFNRRIKVWQK